MVGEINIVIGTCLNYTIAAVTFPGMYLGKVVTESLHNDEGVNKIIELHIFIDRKYREQEFFSKFEIVLNTRFKGYKD